MATRAKTSARMVVLLRPSEKKRLQQLAEREHVSSGEIVRRSLQAYEQNATVEEASISAMISEMSHSLDGALESVRSARAEVAENIARIRKHRAARR